MYNKLVAYGWDTNWSSHWAGLDDLNKDYNPARVVADFGNVLLITDGVNELKAKISGKLKYNSEKSSLPKVGDWVAIEGDKQNLVVHAVLPRDTELARNAAGKTSEKQILAANVDIGMVVAGLDGDFNLPRIKRYMFQLRKSSIRPILVLNKIDLNSNWQNIINDAKQQLELIDVVGIGAQTGVGIDQLSNYMRPKKTIVLLGSSGVGKSTLTNLLVGENIQTVNKARVNDSRGRHTTTHRQLFMLPSGALLIDSPGIRELQLWGDDSDISHINEKITAYSLHCKFNNCRHNTEPGCAVKVAISEDKLSKADLAAFNKFKRELNIVKTKR